MDLPVVELVERWKAGDERSAEELYSRYADRLLNLAGRHMAYRFRSRLDPEDVVQSACRTFFRRARDGQFEMAGDRELWKLLVTITLNKVRNQVAHHGSQKRDPRAEASIANGDDNEFLANCLSKGPTPLAVALLLDELSDLNRRLTARQRKVLELRLDGWSSQQVAEHLDLSVRTIRRSLEDIRRTLRSRAGAENGC